MEKLAHYRDLIKSILHDYAQYRPSHGEIDTHVIVDAAQDHYQLLYLGWEMDGVRRVHLIIVHVRIYRDKIWIEYDGTERGIANDLVEAGVPKDEIVLAFQPLYKRPYTEFAVE